MYGGGAEALYAGAANSSRGPCAVYGRASQNSGGGRSQAGRQAALRAQPSSETTPGCQDLPRCACAGMPRRTQIQDEAEAATSAAAAGETVLGRRETFALNSRVRGPPEAIVQTLRGMYGEFLERMATNSVRV
ncbi:hypothetical protein EVAR_82349_1 [Eumeta japonica]|uniref:Uncharacterized protein n=1 Tax=Eumeta variegata TaxID=151549 RepID=A0A4C1U9U7_EUMVA|nr:hypothetical protein EVAR_82349_1 [Eumeta japonica]